MPKELLRMEGIVKVYPNGFMASRGVTFSVNEGEIHALIGENGAVLQFGPDLPPVRKEQPISKIAKNNLLF